MTSGSTWAPVVAALGASFLAILGSVGFFQWQRRREDQSNAKVAKLAAYSERHAHTFAYAQRVEAIGLVKRLRSGISEGLDVSLRQRKPIEVFELFDWLNADLGPIHGTYSRITVIGSQEAIDVATRVVAACSDLLDASIATDTNEAILPDCSRGSVRTPEQAQTPSSGYAAAVQGTRSACRLDPT